MVKIDYKKIITIERLVTVKIRMEPEDTFSISRNSKMTLPFSCSAESSSDSNLRSVQEIQTRRRRRKREMNMSCRSATEDCHHQCSSSEIFGRGMCPSSSISTTSSFSSSASSLVLFLLMSAVLLFVCVTPSQSLPFDGRSLSNGGSSSSHRSHVDLLIDPILQAEYGDDDPLENTRVVKSVFDMVLRTPPPPTTSSNRCPPGTQSPFEGGPCIKKSTDPVALVDQSFLLDTLRGLAKEGVLLGGPQKSRRPGGSNRRRTSGRPGSRTTSTTTTTAPSTIMTTSEEGLEGEMSPTTGFPSSSSSSATGDNNANVAEEQEMVTITMEPTPSPSPVTTVVASENSEDMVTEVDNKNEEIPPVSSSDLSEVPSDTVEPKPVSPEESPAVSLVPVETPTTDTSPVEDNLKDDMRKAAAPEEEMSSSSSPATGNGKKSSPSSSSNNNSYFSSFQFPFLSSFMSAQHAENQGHSEILKYNTNNDDDNDDEQMVRNYRRDFAELPSSSNYQNAMMTGTSGSRKRYLNSNIYNSYSNRRSRRRTVRTV